MSNCCGPTEKPKKPQQEKIIQSEVKEKRSNGSFWQKLLKSLGLNSQNKDSTGGCEKA